MKSLKKFLALALALALCFVMALPAMADEGTTGHSITINDDNPNHTYNVYQIFRGDVATPKGGTEPVLSNVVWGSAYGKDLDGKADDNLKALLEELADADSAAADAFAKNFLAAHTNAPTVGEITWDANTKSYPALTGLPSGYYLVVDTGTGETPIGNDAISAYMVEIVGADKEITPKKDTPTVDKDVAQPPAAGDLTVEKDGQSYGIGDDVPFVVTAKVPVEQLERFITATKSGEATNYTGAYKLVFKDTMSPSLTLNENSFVVTVRAQKNGTNIAIDEKTETTAGYVKNVTATDKNTTFSIAIENLFSHIGYDETKWPIFDVPGETEGETTKCVLVDLVYTAKLNAGAYVTGDPNSDKVEIKNSAKLEYSNNPNSDGTGETGETPPEEVPVFTFELDGTKIDGATKDEQNPTTLPGATFELHLATDVSVDGDEVSATAGQTLKFLKVTDDEGEGTTTQYILYTGEAEADNESTVVIGKDSDGKDKTVAGIVVTSITTNEDGKFVFKGLKSGDYVLVETKAPDGFNKCNDRLITISEKTDEDGSVTGGYISRNVEIGGTMTDNEANNNGTAITVLNNKGTLLPSTGGIGTTIFYAAGGALVVGAGVLLFIKKRMGSKG